MWINEQIENEFNSIFGVLFDLLIERHSTFIYDELQSHKVF